MCARFEPQFKFIDKSALLVASPRKNYETMGKPEKYFALSLLTVTS